MVRKKLSNIIFAVFIFGIGTFFIYKNYNSASFWNASLIQILTLLVAAGLSFFFVQRLTDKRRKIDCYEHILNEIQNIIDNNPTIFSIDKEALVLQQSVANKIKYLQEHSFSQTKTDLEYIREHFNELRELYGNHKQNYGSLKSIESDMMRHKTNISDKIDKIKLELYDM